MIEEAEKNFENELYKQKRLQLFNNNFINIEYTYQFNNCTVNIKREFQRNSTQYSLIWALTRKLMKLINLDISLRIKIEGFHI